MSTKRRAGRRDCVPRGGRLVFIDRLVFSLLPCWQSAVVVVVALLRFLLSAPRRPARSHSITRPSVVLCNTERYINTRARERKTSVYYCRGAADWKELVRWSARCLWLKYRAAVDGRGRRWVGGGQGEASRNGFAYDVSILRKHKTVGFNGIRRPGTSRRQTEHSVYWKKTRLLTAISVVIPFKIRVCPYSCMVIRYFRRFSRQLKSKTNWLFQIRSYAVYNPRS